MTTPPHDHTLRSDLDTEDTPFVFVLRSGTRLFRLLGVYAQQGDPILSDAEAADQARLRAGYWKRCSDLRRHGWIEKVGHTYTPDTHRKVQACRITPEGREAYNAAIRTAAKG